MRCSIPFASWPIAAFLLLFANTFDDCGIQYAGVVHQDKFYLVGGTIDPDLNPDTGMMSGSLTSSDSSGHL